LTTGTGGFGGGGTGTISVLLTAAALPFSLVAVTLQVKPLPTSAA
jgi:L-cystine uptake protein TcyP (sodium:dicarboxylate symporter family)